METFHDVISGNQLVLVDLYVGLLKIDSSLL